MIKKYLLKASYSEYIRYYKNLKLGLQKACLFLKDLEPELEKLAQKNTTEYRYYNPDTSKEYFFLEKDFYVIRTKIDDLVFEYLMMKPEILSLEESDGFNYIIVQGIKNFELDDFSRLSLLLSQRSNDKAKKLDILARLFLLSKHQITLSASYEKLVTTYGSNIIEFCVTRCKNADIPLILSNFNVKSLAELTTNSNIHLHLAKPLVDFYLSVMPERFSFKENKFVNDCLRADVCDLSMDLNLPKVFATNKNNAYRIDEKKFFFFLQDLDDYRIRLDEKKLNEKVLRIKSLKQFEQMCIRFKTLEAYDKVIRYSCNFLKKNLLNINELNLNDRYSIYILDVQVMLKDVHLERLNLHTKLFNFYVISCFSSYEYNGEVFYEFPNRFNFIKKIKNGRTAKR